MSERTPFLAGNWKMNLDRAKGLALVAEIREELGAGVDVAVFPPFPYVAGIAEALDGSPIRVGAQNMCDEPAGAYTGEVSGPMLADVGATMVILGHSERRHLFGETDELVNRKLHMALATGLDPILCVGETLDEREARRTEDVVARQLREGLFDVDPEDMGRVTIAYEPVWAIGTGHNATPEQAGEVHDYLRGLLSGIYDDGVAEATRIQYGGSVKPSNAGDLMAVDGIDGALVGGASLESESFLAIVRSAIAGHRT